ncbi:hypothetical protein EYF80_000600 [Liparis tanakae]|uniref:Uncharacterized protein n=1 Tax=Liparis tanakae TaxID=230148 RepID=A0A4Z2JJA9_9TELE|nr:hypothetical protein EYF80_000600 [Liparis tanakae]
MKWEQLRLWAKTGTCLGGRGLGRGAVPPEGCVGTRHTSPGPPQCSLPQEAPSRHSRCKAPPGTREAPQGSRLGISCFTQSQRVCCSFTPPESPGSPVQSIQLHPNSFTNYNQERMRAIHPKGDGVSRDG